MTHRRSPCHYPYRPFVPAMVDRAEALSTYDAEMRRDPVPDPGSRVEHDGGVVRVVGKDNYVLYSRLTSDNARQVVAAQADYFRRVGVEVEWKLFGHDRPENLAEILRDEGFVPEEPETLMVFDMADGDLPAGTAPPVEVRVVADAEGLRDAAEANDRAFDRADPGFVERWTGRWADPNLRIYVAYLEGKPVATGRLGMTPGRSFADLWGGGTSPEFRHRGIYRKLVSVRGEFARDRGYRYLTVDARETSRPILERLGFVPLTTTCPWVLRPAPTSGT